MVSCRWASLSWKWPCLVSFLSTNIALCHSRHNFLPMGITLLTWPCGPTCVCMFALHALVSHHVTPTHIIWAICCASLAFSLLSSSYRNCCSASLESHDFPCNALFHNFQLDPGAAAANEANWWAFYWGTQLTQLQICLSHIVALVHELISRLIFVQKQ